jgi:hypothetical protein
VTGPPVHPSKSTLGLWLPTAEQGRVIVCALADALTLLAPGGLYVIDDLLPQANWPDGHGARIEPLLADLEALPGFSCVRLAWASGLALVVRHAEQRNAADSR